LVCVDPKTKGNTTCTQPRLCCSVVGLLRAPLAPRLSGSRGSAPCAFPALSSTRFGLLLATKPHTSGGFGALRVHGGEGVIGPCSGGICRFVFLKAVDCLSRGPAGRSSWLRQLAVTGACRMSPPAPYPRSPTGPWPPCSALVDLMSPRGEVGRLHTASQTAVHLVSLTAAYFSPNFQFSDEQHPR
jgi:hypothetical protein